jgi:hypothetical protein
MLRCVRRLRRAAKEFPHIPGLLSKGTDLPRRCHDFAFDKAIGSCHNSFANLKPRAHGELVAGKKGRTCHMTIQAHIASLEKKHGALEEELQTILASPSSDDKEIADLKRRKLRIKDQMERLRSDTRH